jgi:hypothetical protein
MAAFLEKINMFAMKTGENMRRHCDDKPFMGILSIGWRLEW